MASDVLDCLKMLSARIKQRGIALLLVILVTIVLAILSRTVALTAAQRGFDSLSYVTTAKSTLIAEAGTQFVIDEISRDTAFDTDQTDRPLTTMGGSFSIDFVTPGTSGVTPLQSVNNLEGTELVDGPRGADSVPPGVLDLVLLVNTGSEQRVFETLVRRPASTLNLAAIQSAGEIRLLGTVSIDGIQDPASEVEVDGGLHSSIADASANGIISWATQGFGDTANVTGKVTTTSPSGSAIDMTGANIGGGTETGIPAPPSEDEGILSQIASKSSATPLSPPPVGLVQPGAGEFYAGSDISIDGDLILEDSDIYVNGDLEVNGSIQGTGTVWVSGETRFRGDAIIRTSTEDSVSLMSHGNVELEGFAGLEYLQTLATGDPVFNQNLSDTETAITEIKAAIDANPDPTSMVGGEPLDQDTQEWRRVLADARYGPAGYENNTLEYLRDRVATEPPSPTRDFMVSRLDGLHRVYAESATVPGGETANAIDALTKWQAGDLESAAGYWDYITEYESIIGTPPNADVYSQLINYGRQTSFDKLGTSSFRGVVHTNGSFLAENEVTVVGQVRATGLNLSAPTLVANDGTSLDNGQVLLSNGCHITYCQSYVDKTEAETGSSEWEIAVWIER